MKTKLTLTTLRFLLTLPVAVFAFGCADDDDLGDELEEAGEEVQGAAEEAGEEVQGAAEEAGDEIEDATN